ncbi:Prephenate dehydratase [Sulfolobus islandicus Y.G.57.14]|uniref:Prephenate dehydratase n=7 Tax=Saccharolobus islandicus TaxID=43080 RepID=M9U859_SACIS|nr:prephenate dehydratase [Sulfolobus islandicus]ACP35997.1 Prephenate dehydratase [Sulfolobus islandicus L.S.2.15]ACP38637.1 Prephenate dehydratase [Sulfolobus islandicus M.14.25]ACP46225.1 Prephenate dehydratase [Sulfolobus islandicus Y.G.57.14]ACP55841.1 Prephenate dehydratase [Sulfolobus islandicus M.16.27]ACR42503.1 Prephenate dehydratase [Sulfolobus islandicus M.16.4]
MVDADGIYYLGPEGSFTHEAATLLNKGNLKSESTISLVFKKVDEREGSIGVVPIENSLEGPVNETLDNLYNYDNIYVIGEIERKIELALATRSNDLSQIKRIYSHPHAFNEAREKLKELGFNEYIPVESTSKAAQIVSQDSEAAAICSTFAAKLYNLKVLLTINSHNNYTRFIVLSKEMSSNGNKSMILFTVPHKPGALYKVLQVFYDYNINILMIYSRPLKSIPWQYYFYLEYEGNISNHEFIEKLVKSTSVLKIKGAFSKLNNDPRF